MTAEESVRVQFQVLLEEGGLACSTCSGSFVRALKPLLAADVVLEERRGSGRRFAVRDAAALRAYCQKQYPDAALPEDAGARVAAVAAFRDSKAFASDTADIVIMRGWADTVLWLDGLPVPVTQATRDHGVFAFRLQPENGYQLRGGCALVENPAVLLAFERLNLQRTTPLVCYGGGRVSGRVLDWFARQTAAEFRLVHLPDYDPVGLNEFVRLRTALGECASLHLPDDLAARFARFGNAELLRRPASQALLPKLRSAKLLEVSAVIELIDRYNAGLEQEALFL
jgi:hypothetical protein